MEIVHPGGPEGAPRGANILSVLSLSKTALALAVTATAAAPAASALAAGGSTTLTSPSDVRIEGSYAYFTSYKPGNKPLVQVVVKTKGQMPRRYDGLIRAGGIVDGRSGGGSTGSVGGRQSRCYTFTLAIKDGHFYGTDAKPGKKASTGSKHSLAFHARDADGNTVTSSTTITLRKKTAGDDSGKPLGC